MPARWLVDMQKLGEQVARRHDRDVLEHLAHVPAVVRPVREHMEQHFLSCHGARVAIGELERQTLLQFLAAYCGDIVSKPDIGLSGSEVECTQFGRLSCVCRRVFMPFLEQMGAKNPVYHIDVVKHSDRRVQLRAVFGGGNRSHHIKQFAIGPGLLGKER